MPQTNNWWSYPCTAARTRPRRWMSNQTHLNRLSLVELRCPSRSLLLAFLSPDTDGRDLARLNLGAPLGSHEVALQNAAITAPPRFRKESLSKNRATSFAQQTSFKKKFSCHAQGQPTTYPRRRDWSWDSLIWNPAWSRTLVQPPRSRRKVALCYGPLISTQLSNWSEKRTRTTILNLNRHFHVLSILRHNRRTISASVISSKNYSALSKPPASQAPLISQCHRKRCLLQFCIRSSISKLRPRLFISKRWSKMLKERRVWTTLRTKRLTSWVKFSTKNIGKLTKWSSDQIPTQLNSKSKRTVTREAKL